MADLKISNLTDGDPVAAGDLVEIERPGTPNVTRKATLGDAAGKSVGTGAGNVASGAHTHTLAAITDAGTAAALDEGNSGHALGPLDEANTFSAKQTILSSATGTLFELNSTDDGASATNLDGVRNSASPAANDQLLSVRGVGQNSAAEAVAYGLFNTIIVDPTDGSEDGRFQIFAMVAGALTSVAQFHDGVRVGAATGGFQGAGTINGTAIYDDGVQLTDLIAEFVETGAIDLAKWDAMVPDQVIEASTDRRPVMEEVEVERERLAREGDRMVVRKETVRRKVRKMNRVPVVDETGEPVMVKRNGRMVQRVVEEPVEEIIEVPEKRIKRKHYAAHMFKAMLDQGFDPRDPAKVFQWHREKKCLPGMPDEAEWLARNGKISLGEMQTRAVLASEIVACAVEHALKAQDDRIKALEGAR